MSKFSFESLPHSLISETPAIDLSLSICIPCYDEPDIASTLQSLFECQPIQGSVEIIVLVNEPSGASEGIRNHNQGSYKVCHELNSRSLVESINIYPIYVKNIPPKSAGVGYARRLAMDEANRRFKLLGRDRGVIVCLDADTTVANNYLIEVEQFFKQYPKLEACNIAFEHKLYIENETTRSAICDYESHLRYFINMQRLIGLPFAYQTVGSAMAVTTRSYKKLGGMNTRKAGEDFYFLHKFIKNGLVKELNSTAVYPSSRVSDRVPFGTGKAVGDIIEDLGNYQTYNPESFKVIESFIDSIQQLYQTNTRKSFDTLELAPSLRDYLIKENAIAKIEEVKSNTGNYNSFEKRFFHWFDAFRLMKCLHYLRDHAYPNILIRDAMNYLLPKLGLDITENKYENLESLRVFDRSNSYEFK